MTTDPGVHNTQPGMIESPHIKVDGAEVTQELESMDRSAYRERTRDLDELYEADDQGTLQGSHLDMVGSNLTPIDLMRVQA